MKLLHTADVHIDQPFGFAGDRQGILRKQVRETFHDILQLASAEKYDALLIAGDLFDRNVNNRDTIEWVRQELLVVSGTHVFIVAGTHDLYAAAWVYDHPLLQDLPGHIHIFRPGTNCIEERSLGLAVHAFPGPVEQHGYPALRELKPVTSPEIELNVAMVHGSVLIAQDHWEDQIVVSLDDLANCGMDYVALGHWHKYADYSQKGVPACYSGSPETLSFNQGAAGGKVISIEFDGDAGAARIRCLDVGRHKWCQMEVDVGLHPPGQDLLGEIGRIAAENDVVRIRLVGDIPSDAELDTELLWGECADSCVVLELQDHTRAGPAVGLGDHSFQPGTIAANFARIAGERISAATDEETRKVAEEAARMGLRYLSEGT